jgi:hypothetical protein
VAAALRVSVPQRTVSDALLGDGAGTGTSSPGLGRPGRYTTIKILLYGLRQTLSPFPSVKCPFLANHRSYPTSSHHRLYMETLYNTYLKEGTKAHCTKTGYFSVQDRFEGQSGLKFDFSSRNQNYFLYSTVWLSITDTKPPFRLCDWFTVVCIVNTS